MKVGNVKEFDYDSISPGYYHEVMLKGKKGQRFWHRKKFESVASQIRGGDVSVLDIGCGPGSFFYILRKKNKKARLTGTDIIRSQIEYSRKIVPKAKFFVGDALKMDYKGKFDYVTMIEVIEHLPNSSEKRIFTGIRSLLKGKGRIIVTTPNYISLWPLVEFFWNRISPVDYRHQHINKKTISSMEKSLERYGFRVIRSRSIFILSPFLGYISPGLAEFVFRIEQALFPYLGSVMIVEAEKI